MGAAVNNVATIIAGLDVLAFLWVAWDLGKRHIAAARYNEATLTRLANIDRELEKQHEQQQRILEKMMAASAGVATRLPTTRIGRG